VESVFAITVPVHVAKIRAINYGDSAQISQDALLDVLGYDLEIVDVGIITSLENIVELASTLLGEVECVDLGIDEDARSQVVRVVQESIVLFGLGTGL